MPREETVDWKSTFKIIQLLDDYLKCFIWAADPHVSVREACGANEQKHHNSQGHSGASGKQPSSEETVASYMGECGL